MRLSGTRPVPCAGSVPRLSVTTNLVGEKKRGQKTGPFPFYLLLPVGLADLCWGRYG